MLRIAKMFVMISAFSSTICSHENIEPKKKDLAIQLFNIGAVKFGEYKLKSGMISPIYIDLRTTISYPSVLNKIAEVMYEIIKDKEYDVICGIPMAGLPIACAISTTKNLHMVMLRPSRKDYGTKKMVEGNYEKNNKCLLIDDLITTGGSKIESIKTLEEEGLKIKDVVVLIDRNQGGKAYLETAGYTLSSVFSINELLNYLKEANKVSSTKAEEILRFIAQN